MKNSYFGCWQVYTRGDDAPRGYLSSRVLRHIGERAIRHSPGETELYTEIQSRDIFHRFPISREPPGGYRDRKVARNVLLDIARRFHESLAEIDRARLSRLVGERT